MSAISPAVPSPEPNPGALIRCALCRRKLRRNPSFFLPNCPTCNFLLNLYLANPSSWVPIETARSEPIAEVPSRYSIQNSDRSGSIAPRIISNNTPSVDVFPYNIRQPASRSSIEALTRVPVTDPTEICSICKETYSDSGAGLAMPCKHFFHPDCILSWLGNNNSCPVCRLKLLPAERKWDRFRRLLAEDRLRQEYADGKTALTIIVLCVCFLAFAALYCIFHK